MLFDILSAMEVASATASTAAVRGGSAWVVLDLGPETIPGLKERLQVRITLADYLRLRGPLGNPEEDTPES